MFQADAKRRHRPDSKTFRPRAGQKRSRARRLGMEALEPRMVLTAGTWTALAHAAPGGIGTMELLTDGTVMASPYKLTADATGSYVNGTWSALASPSVDRLYDATNVLKDGRVFVLGGEYSSAGSMAATGEIYNPVTNTWTVIPNFPGYNFGDDPSMLLPDGRVLAGFFVNARTYIYDPAANSWSTGPAKLYGDASDEETWTKLADGSILSYDVFGSNVQAAQRLDPTTMTWIDSGTVPVALQTTASELGPAILLPDGRVFQIGGTSNTALYTPSVTPGGTGTWAAGPVIPGGLGGNDSPAAMLTNGHVLFAAGGTPGYTGPTRIFEFDPTAPIASSLTDVTPSVPNLSGQPSYVTRMLALPSGQVLFTYGSGQLYVYTPSGSPQAAWKPTISSVVAEGDGNYTLSGTQLNGLSAGASYGDDAEMDTNYPIIELNNGSGQVYFARTFNWSSTGVATGSTPVTTDFSLPAGMPSGNYNLSVVANGIASTSIPMSFVVPNADLSVTNTGPTSVTAGTTASYTITLTNNGPDAATNVFLSDVLPAGSILVSMTQTSGSDNFNFAQSEANVIETAIGTIPAGSSDTFNLVVSAPINLNNGLNFSNAAAVSTNATDSVSSNNTATVTGSIVNNNQSADLVVTNVGPSTSTEGSSVTYNLRVTNNGPTDATGVVLTNTLGANLSFVSSTQSQGTSSRSGSVVTFSLGFVGAGQTATATVTAQSTEDGNLTNTASVTSSISDGNTSNNSAIATVAVAEPTIAVSAPITVSGKKVNNQTVATFTHASGVETASAFAATINWGDGSTSAGTVAKSGTSYSVTGSHTYSGNGSHTVTTTVVETEGSPHPAPRSGPGSTVTTPGATASANDDGLVSATVHDFNWANTAGSSRARAAGWTVDSVLTRPTSIGTEGQSDSNHLKTDWDLLEPLDLLFAEWSADDAQFS